MRQSTTPIMIATAKIQSVERPSGAPRRSASRLATEICSVDVQQEFTFLLRETCKGDPLATAGAAVSNGRRAMAGVSRGRSTESNEPDIKTGWPHNSGRAEPGRQNTTIGGLVSGALKPIGPAHMPPGILPWVRPPRLFIHERCARLIECLPSLQHDPNRPEDVLKVDADEDGNGGDDTADRFRYLVATKARTVAQRKLRGL